MVTSMTNSATECRIGRELRHVTPEWQRFAGQAYECRVFLVPEEEGGYSAHAIRLPGVVSEGEAIEEALANIADAFKGAIQAYLANGRAIPWGSAEIERTKDTEERWIVVNV